MADASGWMECQTADGQLYYYNPQTEETSWDKPDALKSTEELENQGDWVWAPDPEEGYVCGQIVQNHHNGDVELQTEDFNVCFSFCFRSSFFPNFFFPDDHHPKKRSAKNYKGLERCAEEKRLGFGADGRNF